MDQLPTTYDANTKLFLRDSETSKFQCIPTPQKANDPAFSNNVSADFDWSQPVQRNIIKIFSFPLKNNQRLFVRS